MTTEQLHEKYEKDLFHFVLGKTKDRAIAEEVCQTTWIRAWEHEGLFDDSKSWLLRVAENLVNDHYRSGKRRPMVSIEYLIERESQACVDEAERCAVEAVEAKAKVEAAKDSAGIEKTENAEKAAIDSAARAIARADAEAEAADTDATKEEADAEVAAEADANPERPFLMFEAMRIKKERGKKLSDLLSRIDPVHRSVIEATLGGRTLSEIANETNTPVSTVKARYHRGKTKLAVLALNGVVQLTALNGHDARCGSIECRPEKHVFYAGR